MEKNIAGKWVVFAFDVTTNLPKTGDAANITANLRIDGGIANAIDDTNPTELEDGYYIFDITATESNGDNIVICPASVTANIQVIGVPGALWTEQVTAKLPTNYIMGSAVQTAKDDEIDAILVDTNALNDTKIPDTLSLANINTQCDTALTDYDPPTRAELTTDKDSIITEVNANETKIDTLQNTVGNLTITGASLNIGAESNTLTVGTETSGTYVDTYTDNSIYHVITEVGGVIDNYYEFDIGTDGLPTEVTINGYLYEGSVPAGGDTLPIYAYNWTTLAWDLVSVGFTGIRAVTESTINIKLLVGFVGSGANDGKVRIRFYNNTLETGTYFNLDYLIVSYTNYRQTIGYVDGAIWVDTVNGSAGHELWKNGTADNSVNNWADALLLSAASSLNKFHIVAGSSITFTSAFEYSELSGEYYTLNLNGQSLSGSYIHGSSINVTGDGDGGTECVFDGCHIGNCTLPICRLINCIIEGKITFAVSGDRTFVNCTPWKSNNIPIIDLGIGVTSTLGIRNWYGAIQFDNITSDDYVGFNGEGKVTIGSSCTGGVLKIRGCSELEDLSGGAVTITDTSRWGEEQSLNTVTNLTNAPTVGDLTSTMKASIADVTLTAQQVWEYATRTITSFGTIIADIWGYATRKLTSAWTDSTPSKDMSATGVLVGTNACNITLYNLGTTTPVADATVSIMNTDESLLVSLYTSDINGQFIAYLDNGTYKLRLHKVGCTFDLETLVVDGEETEIYYGDLIAIGQPASGKTCRVYEYVFNPDDNTIPAQSEVVAVAHIKKLPYNYNGKLFKGTEITATFHEDYLTNGAIYWDMVWGSQIVFDIDNFTKDGGISKIIPEQSSARLSDL